VRCALDPAPVVATRYDVVVEKPPHLGEQYAAQWEDASMADAYPCRPPYPDAVFEILGDLVERQGFVLDLGCGTGDIARPLAARGLYVLAIDRSPAMIARGKALPGGDAAHLVWRAGRAEEQETEAPVLVTAGESFHWFDWSRMPSISRLALIERVELPGAWTAGLRAIIPRYSTNRDFREYDPLAALAAAKRYVEKGSARLPAAPFTQSVADYIRSIHSRNGFSLDRLADKDARAFDEEVAALVAPHAEAGTLTFGSSAVVRWGAFSAESTAPDPE